MKNLIYLALLSVTLISCSEEKQVKRIEWTSTSEDAKVLFEEFLSNMENYRWNPKGQELLMDSILKLDPNFLMAKRYDNFKTSKETRENLTYAYVNREKVSDIESRLIAANYERRINGSLVREDQIIDSLIEDYKDYFQLRILSGDVKNRLANPKGSDQRWKEALEINPNSFEGLVNRAFLHFPTGNNFIMLASDERDLNIAIDLLNRGSKLYPESSRWSRFLGNVYRAQGDFEKALTSYEKSLDIIGKYELGVESDSYANSLLMVGHVYTFTEKYDKAREYYDKGIVISNNYWKVAMSELKAHTFMYQKDFASAIYLLSKTQEVINEMDEEPLTKLNWQSFTEFTKFLAFGHSLQEEETIKSVKRMAEIGKAQLKIQLEGVSDQRQKEKFNLANEKAAIESQTWFNILFGNYEEARISLNSLRELSNKQLEYNPNALNEYFKLSGYLNLMEGNPKESIEDYSKLSKEILTDDGYHYYFLALAKKAEGQNEESKQILVDLANNNFATWQNAVVKNLAKAQIKTNL